MSESLPINNTQKKTIEFSILFGLFILALAIRIYNISSNSIWFDEAWRVSLALYSKDLSIFSYEGLLSSIIKLLGKNEYAIRLPSAVFGALTIPLIYIVSKNYTNRSTSILIALLLCVHPFHITNSQEAAGYTIACFFLLLFGFSFIKIKSGGRIWFYVLMFISAYLISIINIYHVVFIVSVFSINYLKTKKELKADLVFLSILFISLIPFLKTLMTPGKLLTSNTPLFENIKAALIFPATIINSISNGPFPSYYTPNSFRVFKYFSEDLFTKYFLFTGSFVIIISILILGLIYLKKELKREISNPLFLSAYVFILFLTFQSIFTQLSFSRYYLAVLPFFILSIFCNNGDNDLMKKYKNGLILFIIIHSITLISIDAPGKSYKPDARKISEMILEKTLREKQLNVHVLIPDNSELPIYDFYLRDAACSLIYQPTYSCFFELNDWSCIYKTPIRVAEDNKWIYDHTYSIANNSEKIKFFIISQRQKENASKISEYPHFRSFSKNKYTYDHIQVIELTKE